MTTKKFTYLLVKTGTVMLRACSDLRGYTPGQVVRLATEIHNKSGKDTGTVLASLIQVTVIQGFLLAGLIQITVIQGFLLAGLIQVTIIQGFLLPGLIQVTIIQGLLLAGLI